MVFLSAFMLAACDVEVEKDDGASEALAAAEAKLAQLEAYDAQIAAIRIWREVWDSAEVDKLDAIAHSDYTRTAPDLNANSLDELKAFILQVHKTYPDFSITNDGMAAGPDGAFMQWTVTGSDTARGEDATGNSMRVTGISRIRFSDGKIASEIVIFDTGSALTQLDTTELPHTAD
jgi:hypothetical protein